ncbi:ABC transporter substrate-binding protein [Candidatus Eisenbacteria bacterium]|uniref:ABC transporter substrate-binding protein n=1 Tax=Eiseniibacteriota bacterium TaxID=2212470 RepID=A0ABV6YN97_UNCEI
MRQSYRLMHILLALAIVLALSCSREEGGITLMIGGAPAELDYWETLLTNFAQDTGIEVDLMRQPTDTDQRRQSLIVPLKAGESDPDVFLMDIVWIGQFAASGWLEGLEPMMEGDGFDTAPFFERVIDFADTYDGRLVALPVYVDAGLLYYRQDLLIEYGFTSPPATWADLVRMSVQIQEAQRMTNPDFWGFVWQGAQYEGLVCTFLEFATAAGGGLIDQSGALTLDRPENMSALSFMRDLIATFKVSPPNTYTEMKEEEVRSTFQNGNALFERNWPYAWGLHQEEGSAVKDLVGISLLPAFSGGEHAATLGGWHIGISRSSDNKEAAWELVKFIVSRDTQLGFALNLGWNPARQDIYDAPEIAENLPHLVRLREVFDAAAARPNVPYYSLLSGELQQQVNAALSGTTTPAEALKRAQQEGLEIVDRYKQ